MSNDEWGVGDKANSEAFDKVYMGRPDKGRQYDLIHGEHPHSRRDNSQYVRTPDGEILDFDGFRRLIDVTIESSNYLKESGLSGDQVRKEVIGRIFSDGIQIYEFFARDPQYALRKADRLIDELSGTHGWLNADERQKMLGRKIYYMQHPAIITRLIEDQGCVMIEMEPGWEPPAYTYDDNGLGEKYRESWYEDYKDHETGKYEFKTEVISPEIWWWR